MSDTDLGPALDAAVFEPASVPAGTLAVTERLRREGATTPALSAARVQELRRSPPGVGCCGQSRPRSLRWRA